MNLQTNILALNGLGLRFLLMKEQFHGKSADREGAAVGDAASRAEERREKGGGRRALAGFRGVARDLVYRLSAKASHANIGEIFR
jgi:hypothetical protein